MTILDFTTDVLMFPSNDKIVREHICLHNSEEHRHSLVHCSALKLKKFDSSGELLSNTTCLSVGCKADYIKSQKLIHFLRPLARRKAKIVYNFGLSECNRVKQKDI